MKSLLIAVATLALQTHGVSLPDCPNSSHADYDYIVVGAGAGGGPVAARLAEAGFSGMIITYFAHPTGLSDIPLVLVVEAGHDVVNVNTTIPLYFTRAADGEQDIVALQFIDSLKNYRDRSSD
jgi:choline dehydrogenase